MFHLGLIYKCCMHIITIYVTFLKIQRLMILKKSLLTELEYTKKDSQKGNINFFLGRACFGG